MRTRKGWIKSLLGQAIFRSRLCYPLLADGAVIVAFHRVNDTTDSDGLTCSLEMFKQFCQLFDHYFHVVSMRELLEKVQKGTPLNRDLVITFDDGYRDNYDYAAPVLKAMGLPATFFIVTQFIGSDYVPWWDNELRVPQPWMTWDQVQRLHRDGFEIGAHTRTHADLGSMSGDKAWEEIHGSRVELEEKLSAPVDLFAYPYGGEDQVTQENRELVKAAGFRCCCSCFGGIIDKRPDPFFLRRMAVSSLHISPYHLGFDIVARRTECRKSL